jgi:hypothetical protein
VKKVDLTLLRGFGLADDSASSSSILAVFNVKTVGKATAAFGEKWTVQTGALL